MRYYTGIGSRDISGTAFNQIKAISGRLEAQGFVLRSGGAEGSDDAFEEGLSIKESAEIYLPWRGFNKRYGPMYFNLDNLDELLVMRAECVAEEIHPAWDRLSLGARKMHTRNIFQVLGKDLYTPSEFLICYAKPQGDSVKGGTRTAVEVAKMRKIPVINLYSEAF